MKYNIVKKDKKWAVIEIKTNIIIKKFNQTYKAHSLVKTLNQGNGFDGWTPCFFVSPEDRKEAI